MSAPRRAAAIESARLGSRIGLGLAALGRPGYMTAGHAAHIGADKSVDALRARAHAVMDAAWKRGVRYFDAARSYGRAEEFLAEWLAARGLKPDELTVGSKWGYRYTAEWRVDAEVHEIKDHSAAMLREQVEISRRTLGDHLKLYQIHSATLDTGVLDDARVQDALERLRDEGLLVGLSLSGARQAATLERAMSIQRGSAPLFGAVQATWNMLEPSAGATLAEAHASGMVVIVKEALANGYLLSQATAVNGGDGRRGRRPAAGHRAEDGADERRNDALDEERSEATDPYVRARRTLSAEARRLGVTPDALALAFALAQPWVDCVLSGAARIEHVESNLASRSLTIPANVHGRLQALAMPGPEYWRHRSTLAWT